LSILIYPLSSQRSLHHSDLHSFPTRRSSDLDLDDFLRDRSLPDAVISQCEVLDHVGGVLGRCFHGRHARALLRGGGFKEDPIKRSEEHTSELQSRGHLVCRLLLEKKKKKKKH